MHPNIMTMSWHTMMEFEPPLGGCFISNGNYSFGLLRATKACVLNIPTAEIAEKVVALSFKRGAGLTGVAFLPFSLLQSLSG
ncbi:MAG: hypothetical protein RI601_03555 [Desulfurivibrionaceae bacterium]|nr:hypothetical protein [Desulfurivibrionaceae bacterium]